MTDAAQPTPFKINLVTETLDWVTQRVQSAHVIPDVQQPAGKEWADGTPSTVMNDLVDYWKNTYDWRKVETRLNATYNMFTVDIPEGDEVINLHFVHHRSDRPGAIPLLFAHGWPGNFTEVESLLSLTAPEDPKQQAFHIIAPSIPGFVFSSSPKAPSFGFSRIAEIYHKLMIKLGYNKYLGQGGDFGSLIHRAIAQRHPESCLGIHLNFVLGVNPSPIKNPLTLLRVITRWFTPEEKKLLDRAQWWFTSGFGYAQIQGTKPQTVSYGLLDSPIGMLAWIREIMERAVTPGYVWDKEKAITWAMLYLLSNSAWHARIYKELIGPGAKEQVLDNLVPSSVALGASIFPYDVAYIPIWWAKAVISTNIVFWKEHETGGHFASVERPDLLKADIWEFVGKLPAATKRELASSGGVGAKL